MTTNKRIIYVPLEPYISRYTYQLLEWNKTEFERLNIPYVVIEGETLDNSKAIVTGQVLDAHGRSYYALSQMMKIVKMLKEGEIVSTDVLFFEDMFHPGIESLPYIFDQTSERPSVFVRCLAQTIDPDDFVHVWGMYPWMSKFEHMTSEFVDGILCASEEMIPNIKIAGWKSRLYVTGLPFGKKEVQGRVKNIKPFNERKNRVVFAARWDQEKQPDFFMDLIERKQNDSIEFAILSGGKLKSNNTSYMDRTKRLVSEGKLTIYENLSKDKYYEILNDSKILFNCALQDWVSNTVSEADTLGCNVLYPAYRSFSEVFSNCKDRLYIPWSLEDAENKMYKLLREPHKDIGKISDYQDKTIERTCDILMFDKGYEKYMRNQKDYRKHILESKY